MVIVLSVRRLFCNDQVCQQRTFAEQVPGLTIRYGRRTPLLHGCWSRSRWRWPAAPAPG
jgi:hypothetical protein